MEWSFSSLAGECLIKGRPWNCLDWLFLFQVKSWYQLSKDTQKSPSEPCRVSLLSGDWSQRLRRIYHPRSFNQCPACLMRIAPGWCPRPDYGQHPFVPLTRMGHDSTGLANNYMLWTDQFSQFTVQSKLILENKGFRQQGATWESSMPV